MRTPSEHAAHLLELFTSCLGLPFEAEPLARLEAALLALDPPRLATIDEALRASTWRYGEDWSRVSPKDVTSTRLRRVPWAVAAVAASHPSGFVRQAAVRTLGEAGDGAAVPFLALRLNDWVEEVRRAAQASLAGYVALAFAADLLRALPLFGALERKRRSDHGPVRSWVLGLLRSDECRPVVEAGFASPDRDLRRACFELALGGAHGAAAEILGRALRDREPASRLWAVRRVAEALPLPWAIELGRTALGDRSVQVRRTALSVLAPVLPADETRALAEAALLDGNTSARWQARALRLALGPFDLAAFYRRALATPKSPSIVRGALLGLGESGTRCDVDLIAPFAAAGTPGLRAVALRAWASLEDLATVAPFTGALESAEGALSKAGRRALMPRMASVSREWLLALVADGGRPVHVRLHALALGNHLGKWRKLPLLLAAIGADDPLVASRARAFLGSWWARYNRSFVQPSSADLDEIEATLERVAGSLGDRATANLRQIVELMRR